MEAAVAAHNITLCTGFKPLPSSRFQCRLWALVECPFLSVLRFQHGVNIIVLRDLSPLSKQPEPKNRTHKRISSIIFSYSTSLPLHHLAGGYKSAHQNALPTIWRAVPVGQQTVTLPYRSMSFGQPEQHMDLHPSTLSRGVTSAPLQR
nr:hypothetical protein [Salmonella sp.]